MAKNTYTVTINVNTNAKGLTELDTKLRNLTKLAKEVESAINNIGNKSPKGFNKFGKSVTDVTKQIGNYNNSISNTNDSLKRTDADKYANKLNNIGNAASNSTKKTREFSKSQQEWTNSTRKTVQQQERLNRITKKANPDYTTPSTLTKSYVKASAAQAAGAMYDPFTGNFGFIHRSTMGGKGSLMYQRNMGKYLSQFREKMGNFMDVGMMGSMFLGGLGLKNYLIDTPAKAETNNYLLGLMGDSDVSGNTLYSTLDKVTDKLPIGMQSIVQPLNAFKAATGASASDINKIIPEFANFGAVAQMLSGSTELAETAMIKLAHAYQGAYAGVDQFGVTKEAVERELAKKYEGVTTENMTVTQFMDAVNSIVGDASGALGTFNGRVQLLQKSLNRAGKDLWTGGLGTMLGGGVSAITAFLDAGDGFIAKIALMTASVAEMFTGVLGGTGYALQAAGNFGGALDLFRDARSVGFGNYFKLISGKLSEEEYGKLMGAGKIDAMGRIKLGTPLASQSAIEKAKRERKVYGTRAMSGQVEGRTSGMKQRMNAKYLKAIYGIEALGDAFEVTGTGSLRTSREFRDAAKKSNRNVIKSGKELREFTQGGFWTKLRVGGKASFKGVGDAFKGKGAYSGAGKLARAGGVFKNTLSGLGSFGSILSGIIPSLSMFSVALIGAAGLFAAFNYSLTTSKETQEKWNNAGSKINDAFLDIGALVGDIFQSIGVSDSGGLDGIIDVCNSILDTIADVAGGVSDIVKSIRGEDSVAENRWSRNDKEYQEALSEAGITDEQVNQAYSKHDTEFLNKYPTVTNARERRDYYSTNGWYNPYDQRWEDGYYQNTYESDKYPTVTGENVHDAIKYKSGLSVNQNITPPIENLVQGFLFGRMIPGADMFINSGAYDAIQNKFKDLFSMNEPNGKGTNWWDAYIRPRLSGGNQSADSTGSKSLGIEKRIKPNLLIDLSSKINTDEIFDLEGIQQSISSFFSSIFGDDPLGSITQGLGSIWDSITGGKQISGALENHAATTPAQPQQATSNVSQAAPNTQGFLSGLTSALETTNPDTTSLANNISTSLSTNLQQSLSTSLSTSIQTALNTGIMSSAEGIGLQGQTIANSLKTGFDMGMTTFSSGVDSQISTAVTSITSHSGEFSSAGQTLGNSAKDGFASGISGFSDAASAEMDAALSAITSRKSEFYAAGYANGQAAAQGAKDGDKVGSPGLFARMFEHEMNYALGFMNSRTRDFYYSGYNNAVAMVNGSGAGNTGFDTTTQLPKNLSNLPTSNTSLSQFKDNNNSVNETRGMNDRPIVINNNIEKVDSKQRVKEIAEAVWQVLNFNNETAGRHASNPFPDGG